LSKLAISFEDEEGFFDPTTVLLSDPGGTYGVKRNDTDETLVPDGTAMTRLAEGIYEYAWTDPAVDLTYTVYVEYEIDEATTRDDYLVDGPAAAFANTYCVTADLEQVWGSTNVEKWSDLDNDKDAVKMLSRQALACRMAYVIVNDYMADSRYAVPLLDKGTTTTPLAVQNVAAVFAGVWLYNNRGVHDTGLSKRGLHRLSYNEGRAWAKLRAVRAGRQSPPWAPKTGTYACNAPVAL